MRRILYLNFIVPYWYITMALVNTLSYQKWFLKCHFIFVYKAITDYDFIYCL